MLIAYFLFSFFCSGVFFLACQTDDLQSIIVKVISGIYTAWSFLYLVAAVWPYISNGQIRLT